MTGDTREKRLWNLIDALARDACRDTASVENDLYEAGLEPDEVKQRGVRFVKKFQQNMRLDGAVAIRQRQQSRLSELRKQVKERLDAYEGQSRNILRQTLSNHPELELSFRKIESMDPADMLDILGEIELLKLLSEIEEE